MKRIYINKKNLKEAVDYLNNKTTFFAFLSHVKDFLKKLLKDSLQANVDDYLINRGLSRKTLINLLLDKGILEKETKIDEKGDKDKFIIIYKVPKKNFERKMKRIYTSLFEKNEIKESIITEDGEGGCISGDGNVSNSSTSNIAGATTTNNNVGFVQPLTKKNGEKTDVMRRKIYVTNEQINFLKETDTQNTGDYQYTVPFPCNSNDPSFNHQNMIANGIPNKKRKKK